MNEEKQYIKDIKKEEKRNKKKANRRWLMLVTIMAFTISMAFSALSEAVMPKVNIFVGILIMFLFIGLGIIFDMVGVAVTAADDIPFHSMAAKKIKGADMAVIFKKNAAKVSSFFNDVIGDICGIISGSAGVYIASGLSKALSINSFFASLFITGVVSALTIGGKAICKGIAINNSTSILFDVSKIVSKFYKVKCK